jgi:hypothetical protein
VDEDKKTHAWTPDKKDARVFNFQYEAQDVIKTLSNVEILEPIELDMGTQYATLSKKIDDQEKVIKELQEELRWIKKLEAIPAYNR